LILGWAGSAFAEPVELLQNQYKPLINTRAGRIEGCGVHFSAIISTLDSRLMNIQGSVNTAYVTGRYPGLMIKVAATEVKNGVVSVPKIHFAGMRIGAVDTQRMTSMTGENDRSILLLTDMQKTGDFFATFPASLHEGAWLSFSLDTQRGDYTFRLPPFAQSDADTLKQVNECDALGLQTLMNEIAKVQVSFPMQVGACSHVLGTEHVAAPTRAATCYSGILENGGQGA